MNLYAYNIMSILVNQKQFRNCVQKRDHKCLIAKYDECECDACHIVPYTICNQYNWTFKFDRRNGLFLTKSLHTLFDQFYWTFDIYDLQYNNNKYYTRIIVMDNYKTLFINSFKDQYIAFPVECLPFLYTHYQMYVIYNYEKSICNNVDVTRKYYEIIQDDTIFNLLINNRIPIEILLQKRLKEFLIDNKFVNINCNDFFVNAILKHKHSGGKTHDYLVWWDHLPMSDASWESKNNLQNYSVDFYHDRIQNVNDPLYI